MILIFCKLQFLFVEYVFKLNRILIEVVKTTSATCVADGPMGKASTSSIDFSNGIINKTSLAI